MATVTQADDVTIKRGRGGRTFVFFATPALLALVLGSLFGYLAVTFIGDERFYGIGFTVGAVAGLVSFLAMKHNFIVQNDTTGLLVTLDQLQSLLGKKPHVTYGPGTHFSYPWEARFAKNNIPVEEVAEDFSFTAICVDGTISGTGSFRLRPDVNNPINYLSGVAAVSKDFADLLKAFITDWFADKSLQQAVSLKHELNRALRDHFAGNDVMEFEERFGIQVGDITVGELKLSKEVEEARNAINEAAIIAQGTAALLGYDSVSSMQEALSQAKITPADVESAQRRFLIVSGQIADASTTRFEIDIKGLSPEAAAAFTAFMQNPANAQIVRNMGNKRTKGNKS